jgi:uncharacterized protein YlxW (UPF0749 family)
MMLVSQYIEQFITGIVVMLIGGVTWLFRTVFTNQKEIALLKDEIANRTHMREEDRAVLLTMRTELKEDNKEMRQKVDKLQSDISELWKHK